MDYFDIIWEVYFGKHVPVGSRGRFKSPTMSTYALLVTSFYNVYKWVYISHLLEKKSPSCIHAYKV